MRQTIIFSWVVLILKLPRQHFETTTWPSHVYDRLQMRACMSASVFHIWLYCTSSHWLVLIPSINKDEDKRENRSILAELVKPDRYFSSVSIRKRFRLEKDVKWLVISNFRMSEKESFCKHRMQLEIFAELFITSKFTGEVEVAGLVLFFLWELDVLDWPLSLSETSVMAFT